MGKTKSRLIAVILSALVIVTAACSASNNPDDKSNTGGNGSGVIELTVTPNGSSPGGSGDVDDLLKQREADVAAGERAELKTPYFVQQYDFTKKVNELLASENINLNYLDWGWDVPLIQKQTAAFVAKEGPDVFTGELQMPGFARQGLFEPFPAELEKRVRENVVQGAYELMEVDGKIYGVSSATGVNNLYWNKDLLRKAGLDPDKAPATWEEWVSNIEKITAAGNGEFFGGGLYAGPNGGGWLRFGPLMVINGGYFVDADNQPSFNTPENIESFQLLRDIAKHNPKGMLADPTEAPVNDGFAKGKIAYIINWPWQSQGCKDIGLDCGMSEIPLSPNGQSGNVTIGAAIWAVPAYVKNKEAAFKFIEATISQEAQEIIAYGGDMPPVLKNIAETKEYQDKYPNQYIVYQSLQGKVKGLPTFDKEDTKTWEVFSNAMVEAQVTDRPIKAILDDAQAKAMQLQQ